MAEQFLDTAQIRTVVEHVRCKAVAQRMRTDCRIQSGDLEILVHLPADAPRAETLAMLVHEQDFRVEIAVALGSFVSVLHVVLYGLERR
jgi:hypothetical protein